MIIVDNQYFLDFSLNDRSDFIQSTQDLIVFETVQQSGNRMPMFNLEFYTKDFELPKFLNEGNVFNLKEGIDLKENYDQYELVVLKRIKETSGDKIYIKIIGTINKLNYFNTDILITDKLHGVNALKQVTGNFFRFESNVTNINSDSMYWVKSGESYKKFVDKIWFHTYIPNSFLATAITLDNRFILKDIKKDIQDNQYKFKLTTNIEEKNDIAYNPKIKDISESGWLNSFFGYKRIKEVFNIDLGEINQLSSTNKPLMALTNKLMRSKEILERHSEIGYTNENKHTNYEKAFLDNISNLALYSTITKELSFTNQFHKINLLDKVFFEEFNPYSGQLVEYNSGIYYINKIKSIIGDNKKVVKLIINREADNQPKGDLI